MIMKTSNSLKLSQIITHDREIQNLIADIQHTIQTQPISDLVDDQGHQYVDLVLEGGGVLGIALAGYTYALEQAGIRFLNIAGTSAGAINAVFLATLAKPNEIRSIKLIEVLDNMPMEKFIDGGKAAKAFVKAMQEKPDGFVDKIPELLILAYDKIFKQKKWGINPAHEFEKWLNQNLHVQHPDELKSILQLAPNVLKIRSGRATYQARENVEDKKTEAQRLENIHNNIKLSIVTADVTTQSKIIFPEMAELFEFEDHNQLTQFIRASMAIPLFFEPVILTAHPNQKIWNKYVSYQGSIPTGQKCYLVDGGIMSNFPIDIFHQRKYVPLCPTFGVKLDTDRTQPNETAKITKFLGALFDTARHTSDFNFLHKNDDYTQLITYIDIASHKIPKKIKTGLFNLKTKTEDVSKFHWLDFNMPTDKKVELFTIGVKAAHDFITANNGMPFNWDHYKTTRQNLIDT